MTKEEREVMRMALEAMNLASGNLCETLNHSKKLQHKIGEPCPAVAKFDAAITAIEKCLANDPVDSEPVAWYRDEDGIRIYYETKCWDDAIPLYTAPQPWEKFCDSNCVWTDHHPDCKLAEQEPVACVTYKEVADTMNGLWGGTLVQRQIAEELENTMLYTTPPQRTWVGLNSEEIRKAKHHMVEGAYQYSFKQGAEWAEAQLKEKNNG